MIIQVYAIVSEENALALTNLGVDHIGVVADVEGNKEKGIISIEKAKKIINIVRQAHKKSSVILNSNSITDLVKLVLTLQMDILHICSEMNVSKLGKLKQMLRKYGTELTYTIPVESEKSIEKAVYVEQIVDYIMLDSPGESKQMKGFIGATGKTHNWLISKKIVDTVKAPVILAGGLSTGNIQKAIKTVHPAGVDVKTSLDLPYGNGKKDIEKTKAFVEKVREVS